MLLEAIPAISDVESTIRLCGQHNIFSLSAFSYVGAKLFRGIVSLFAATGEIVRVMTR